MPKTVLVVDDQEPVVELVGAALESAGYRVLKAYGCDGGLQILSENGRTDLILSDILMGNPDGYIFIERARETGYRGKVIFMSGLDNREEAMRHRADGYLRKPFKGGIKMLLTIVGDIIGEAGPPETT